MRNPGLRWAEGSRRYRGLGGESGKNRGEVQIFTPERVQINLKVKESLKSQNRRDIVSIGGVEWNHSLALHQFDYIVLSLYSLTWPGSPPTTLLLLKIYFKLQTTYRQHTFEK